VPSPNKYTVVVPMSKVSGKIGMKLKSELDQAAKSKTPGPGSYKF